jgi:hypothetical protein
VACGPHRLAPMVGRNNGMNRLRRSEAYSCSATLEKFVTIVVSETVPKGTLVCSGRAIAARFVALLADSLEFISAYFRGGNYNGKS